MKKLILIFASAIFSTGVFSQSLYIEGQMRVISDIFVGEDLQLDNDALLSVAPGGTFQVDGSVTNNADSAIYLMYDDRTTYGQLKFHDSYSGNGKVSQAKRLEAGWNFIAPTAGVQAMDYFRRVGASGPGHTALTKNLYLWDKVNYFDVDSVTDLTPGLGYVAFVGQNGIVPNPGDSNFVGVVNSTVNVGGFDLANDADESLVEIVSVGATGQADEKFGWNLFGNPFTCNLDAGSIPNSDFNSAVYYNTAFETYVAISPAGIDDAIVPPLTAYWMQASGSNPSFGASGNISMENHGTFSTATATLPRTSFDRLVLRTSLDADTSKKDHTVLAFIERTTDGFDGEWDAHKMLNSGDFPNIYSTYSNRNHLANNAIPYGPAFSDKKTVPVSFRASQQGGGYTISYDDSYMINHYTVYLEDKLEQTFTDMLTEDYSFVNDTNMINRFVVHFRAGALSIDAPEDLNSKSGIKAWVFHDNAYIKAHMSSALELTLYDMSGRNIQSERTNVTKGEQYEWPLRTDLSSGVYLLRVKTAHGTETIKFTKN